MSRNSYAQGKQQRASEKAQKKRAKAERRKQRKLEGPEEFEVVSAEEIVGRLPSSAEAMRMIQEREAAPKAAATVPCKLFVGSLTDIVTETVLRDIFSPFGKIAEAVIITDRNTNQSRGFAFVTFEDRNDGAKAIEELDGSELDGRRITVKVATGR